MELKGKGVALGVKSGFAYESSAVEIREEEQLIVIGSDGIWEAESPHGEQFGKDRFKQILADNWSKKPEQIIKKSNNLLDLFLDGRVPQDDVTLMIIKINGSELVHTSYNMM